MKFKSFSDYLTEQKGEIVFVFGRFNPPTTGHAKLFDELKKVARGNQYRVYASQSSDKKKNPLTFKEKIKFLRKMFPKHARNIMADQDVKNVIDIAVKLYEQGYTKITMVAGSDRVAEFEKLLNKYNGVTARHGYYEFKDSIKVVSAGDRDPDSDDVSGMSASKLRAAAAANDLETFSKGMPEGFKQITDLFNAVRTGMGLSESHNYRKDIRFAPVSETREKFVQGNLVNVGDLVTIKESGDTATVKYLGANYVIVEQNEKTTRKWLDAIEVIEERKNAEDPDVKDMDGSQPKNYYKGLSKKDKEARAKHFAKYKDSDDDNPASYKPAPGDKDAKTKPSKHTKNFKKMYGEETELDESKAKAALKNKAEKSGMPYGILKKVYDRGVAAWRTGHRPGTNPHQWGLARVNSFATKSKGTWGGADKDLAAKVRG